MSRKFKGGNYKNGDKVVIKGIFSSIDNNTIYLNYDMDPNYRKTNGLFTLLPSKQINDNSIWIIEKNEMSNTMRLKTNKTYYSDFYKQNRHGYLDIGALDTRSKNPQPLIWWDDAKDKNDMEKLHKQEFIITDKNIIKNTLNGIRKLYYEPLEQKFYNILNYENSLLRYELFIEKLSSSSASPKLKKTISFKEKNKPLLIYLIGQEHNDTRTYLCTFLHQIDFYKKNCGINNDRINLIYGENGYEDPNYEHTCYNTHELAITDKSKSKLNKSIPYGIDVNYLNKNINNQNLLNLLNYILSTKANSNTPIIFIYDGHGYTNSGNKNGNMILRNGLEIDVNFLNNVFQNYKLNTKLFLFSQCGSYDFAQRLFNSLTIDNKSIIFSAGAQENLCTYGFKVIRQFTDLIDKNSYNTFIDLYNDNRELQRNLNIKINSIQIDDIFYNK